MFRSARIKLTAWYLLIIMLISISFSTVIYKTLTLELERFERVQRLRVERSFPGRVVILSPPSLREGAPGAFLIDPNLVVETKKRIKIALITINALILGTSALAAYFLAGRTLKPIQEMVDEQNRFITDASHELRTPITALKSEIEVSLRDPNLSIDEVHRLLKSNLEEVDNLQLLSDELIKLTQYQKGKNGLSFDPVSVRTAIEEALKKVGALAKSRNIRILNNVGEATVMANQPALVELFTIFLDNAIKYSPDGTEVRLSSQKSGRELTVQIEDQGIGISEKDIPHLFERFFRADRSRDKRTIPGYGLGLAIARQIIERHGGSVKVESPLGKGTIFSIQLPLKRLPDMT